MYNEKKLYVYIEFITIFFLKMKKNLLKIYNFDYLYLI